MSSVLNYFLKILEKKDYSIKELWLKAEKRDYQTQEIREAINKLIEHKYIDDDRLASFLVEKYSKLKGEFWIKQKLQQRLIPKTIIEKYLLESKNSEPDLFSLKAKIARKYKITNWQEIDPKVKNKILGFLSRSGFSNIYNILNKWINGQQDSGYSLPTNDLD